VLPALDTGGCINVLRIENGTLNELAKLFVDVFTGSRVRVGSLILLSSVSHLAAVGTAAYAESFVRAAKFLDNAFGGKVAVRVGVPVLLGGARDSSLVRSLFELAAWTDGLSQPKEHFPSEARRAFSLCLKNNGVGKALQVETFKLQLPTSLLTFEKKTVVSSCWDSVFTEIKPFDSAAEKLIVDALVTEANKNFSLHLATKIDFNRKSPCTDDQPTAGCKTIIVVGASHASNLCKQLIKHGFNAVAIEMKCWRPNSSTVEETLTALQKALTDNSNITAIIYFCLDSAAFYGLYEDSILPARPYNGVYHIEGAMVLAPSEMFTKSIRTCLPLFSCNTDAKKVVLSPLPRYWMKRCCTDTDHCSNLEESDYEANLFSVLVSLRRIIKDVLFTSGLTSLSVYNSGQMCTGMPGGRHTGDDIKDALAILWGDDPIHPGEECYDSLATSLVALLNPTDTTDSGSTQPTPAPKPAKRPRWLETDACSTVAPRGSSRGRAPLRGSL
jgi:hypothetical protein